MVALRIEDYGLPRAYSHVWLVDTARHLNGAHPATRPRPGQ